MLRFVSFFFGFAAAIATVITLIGYLAAIDTSFATFMEDHYDVILAATGLFIFGLMVIGGGIAFLYDSFNPLSLLVGLAIIGGGVALLVVGGGIVTHLVEAASAIPAGR